MVLCHAEVYTRFLLCKTGSYKTIAEWLYIIIHNGSELFITNKKIMQSSIKKLSFLMCLAVVFASVAAYKIPAPARKVKLGFIPLTDCAPLVVAKELGLFAKYGVDVELSKE